MKTARVIAGLLVVLSQQVAGEDLASDFGTSGLIKMPTARMASDGTLRATLAYDDVANLYNITFQALPRVQATFRYAIFNPSEIASSIDYARDRSYGIKTLISEESYMLPSLAVGARDILGTGAWEGEYIVASKKWGGADFSLGMGWGRLGTRGPFDNPLSLISNDFETRPGFTGGEQGGESRGASFFRGDSSIFGGIAYKFSPANLVVLAEVESDDYNREVRLGTLKDPSSLNFAILWRPTPNLSLRLAWLRGDTLGIMLSSELETNKIPPRKVQPFRRGVDVDERTGLPPGYDADSWYDRIVYEGEQTGLYVTAGRLEPESRRASVVIENRSYNLTADALNQTLLLSELYLPSQVSQVDILLEEHGLVGPTINYKLQRKAIASGSDTGTSGQTYDQLQILAPRRLKDPTNETVFDFPALGLEVDLAARAQLMDPEDPVRKQIYAKVTARLQFSFQTNVWARYEQDLKNDFSTTRQPNSVLPNVRSQVNRYLAEGSSGIEQLYLEDKRSISSSVHSRMFGGILEQMYVGVGGEVLYAPYNRRWALGANLVAVKQRGFERDFEMLDYETVTGFASIFYAAPLYNVDFAVHVGRYLAKDVGYTVEARRTFDSGFSVGGFFTRTNVSAQEFGEGSFDKGLFFRIPFDGFLPGNTRSAFSTVIRPLERDGGRRLDNFGGGLWFERRNLRFDAIDRNARRAIPK